MKIKSILTRRYEVSLYETGAGYQIVHGQPDQLKASEEIADYLTADYLFELKYAELEGQ